VATHGRTIRLPSHIIEQLSRLYTVARDLQSALGRPPTVVEIAEKLGVQPEKVLTALRAARLPLSLETPVGTEAESTLASFIADTVLRPPAEEAEEAAFSDAEALQAALKEYLTTREVTILNLRYGLTDGRERTMAEVANEVGLSRDASARLRCRRCRNCAPRRCESASANTSDSSRAPMS